MTKSRLCEQRCHTPTLSTWFAASRPSDGQTTRGGTWFAKADSTLFSFPAAHTAWGRISIIRKKRRRIALPDRWFVTFNPEPDIRYNFGRAVTGQTGRLFVPADLMVGEGHYEKRHGVAGDESSDYQRLSGL
jgi:hypothetical protein